MMRALVIAVVACSTPKKHETQPPPVSTCAKVADHIVALMSGAQKFPPEATDPFRRIVGDRCEHDRWSDESQRCLLELTALDQGERCQRMMTKEQVDAFQRDTEAALGEMHSQMHETPVDAGGHVDVPRDAGPGDSAPAG